jgi:hypothetical protein
MKSMYVVSTIIISYLCKKTGDHKYSHVKSRRCFLHLINTYHIMNFAKSNDRYEVTGIEWDYEKSSFKNINLDLCNTVH